MQTKPQLLAEAVGSFDSEVITFICEAPVFMQALMCPRGSSPPVRRGKREKYDTEQKMLKENKGQGNKIWRVFSEIGCFPINISSNIYVI